MKTTLKSKNLRWTSLLGAMLAWGCATGNSPGQPTASSASAGSSSTSASTGTPTTYVAPTSCAEITDATWALAKGDANASPKIKADDYSLEQFCNSGGTLDGAPANVGGFDCQFENKVTLGRCFTAGEVGTADFKKKIGCKDAAKGACPTDKDWLAVGDGANKKTCRPTGRTTAPFCGDAPLADDTGKKCYPGNKAAEAQVEFCGLYTLKAVSPNPDLNEITDCASVYGKLPQVLCMNVADGQRCAAAKIDQTKSTSATGIFCGSKAATKEWVQTDKTHFELELGWPADGGKCNQITWQAPTGYTVNGTIKDMCEFKTL